MFKVFDTLLNKLRDVINFGQHLCVGASLNKSLQVLIDRFNRILIAIVYLQDINLFVKSFLFLLISSSELQLELISFFLKFFYYFSKANVNEVNLLLFHANYLIALMLNKAHIIIIDSAGLFHHLAEISYILTHDTSNLIELRQFMAIASFEHASGADQLLAVATKIFNVLLRMLLTGNLSYLVDTRFHGANRMRCFRRPV